MSAVLFALYSHFSWWPSLFHLDSMIIKKSPFMQAYLCLIMYGIYICTTAVSHVIWVFGHGTTTPSTASWNKMYTPSICFVFENCLDSVHMRLDRKILCLHRSRPLPVTSLWTVPHRLLRIGTVLHSVPRRTSPACFRSQQASQKSCGLHLFRVHTLP